MSDLSWKRRLLVIGVLIVFLGVSFFFSNSITGFAVVTNNDPKVNHVMEDELVQLDAYVDSPVTWRRTVTFDEPVNSVTIDIDKTAIDYSVTSVTDGVELEIDNNDVVDNGVVGDVKVLDVAQKMDKIIVEYTTPAPTIAVLQNKGEQAKDTYFVTVSSDVHYTNVIASLSIPAGRDMQVFQRVGNRRYAVPSTLVDTDGDDKTDQIQWAVPHLSDEEYEVDLMVLNVHSYPAKEGNWTVMFNTSGTADLSIEPFNGTTWKDEGDGADLEFFEVSCDGVVQPYEWNETDAVVLKGYTCDGKTSAEVSQVHTTGPHNLRFTYGDVVAYAYNNVGDWTLETAVEGSADDFGQYNSMAINSTGDIHVSYYDNTGKDLEHAWQDHATGTWNLETIDAVTAGRFSSITINSTNGIHISYYEDTGKDLKHAWYDPTSDKVWHTEVVHDDGANAVGQWTSITTNSTDDIHISYWDYTGGDLEHAWYDHIAGTWHLETVDNGGANNVGQYSSITINSTDDIHISYHDSTAYDLEHAWYDNDAGTWHTETIDDVNNVGTYTSITANSTQGIHISYYYATGKDLKHAWYDPTSDKVWHTEVVHDDGANAVGQWTSITTNSTDDIHISYHDVTGGDLEHAWQDHATGTWNLETIDANTAGTIYSNSRSIVINSTNDIHVSYYEPLGKDLEHAWQDHATGTWHLETPDDGGGNNEGQYTSITTNSTDDVHIAYYDASLLDLEHAWYDNDAGTWHTETIDSVGSVGTFTDIITNSTDDVHISYYDATGGDLEHAWYDTDAGTWHLETIDASTAGQYNSMAINSTDDIHISYHDVTGGDLEHAWQDHITGTWHTETVESANAIGQYTSITINSTQGIHISYYDVTGLNLKHAWYDPTTDKVWHTEIVHDAGENTVGTYTSITTNSTDDVHISYWYSTGTDLEHAWQDHATGTWTLETIDANTAGSYSSITTNSTNGIHISYYESTGKDLKHAWYDEATDKVWHTEVVHDDGANIVGYWTSITTNSTDDVHIIYYDNSGGDLEHAWFDELDPPAGDILKPTVPLFGVANNTAIIDAGDWVSFWAIVNDGVALDSYSFRTNATLGNAWTNQSWTGIDGTGVIGGGLLSNVTFNYTIVGDVGEYVCGEFYVNDTANNWNHSVDYSAANLGKLNNSICFTVTDTVKTTVPDFNIANDTTKMTENSWTSWWSIVKDDIQLDSYNFRTNATVNNIWGNQSWSGIAGTGIIGALVQANVTFNYTILAANGTYSCGEFYVNDTANNWNHSVDYSAANLGNYNSSQCFNVSDATKPHTNDFQVVNDTTGLLTGEVVTWAAQVEDNVYLDWYQFRTNDTGAWTNDSHWFDINSSYTPTGYTGNITWNYTITAAVGTYICGEFYFNDTSNNWNHSVDWGAGVAGMYNNSQCFTVTDTVKPTVSDFGIANNTATIDNGDWISWWVIVEDGIQLDAYNFRTNATAGANAWTNQSWSGIDGDGNIAGTGPLNVTFNYTIVGDVGEYVCGEFYANDTSNNFNHSVDYSTNDYNNSQCFTVTDTIKPTAPNFGIANNTASLITGDSASWWAVLNDNIGLSAYQFRTNDSGAWLNQSWSGALGGIATINQSFNYTITAGANTYICGEFYFNDTSNNFNHSVDYSTNTYNSSQCFTIAAVPAAPSADTGGGNERAISAAKLLFDVVITSFDKASKAGEFFTFGYLLKGMGEINDDVQIEFWLQKDNVRVTSGKDTVYFGSFEEKTGESELQIPSNIEPGVYEFVIKVTYKDYTAESRRTVELKVDAEGNVTITEVKSYKTELIIVSIASGLTILGAIIWFNRHALLSVCARIMTKPRKTRKRR